MSSYIEWFKGKQRKVDLSNVTIRQLLSHNSGIFRDGTEHQWLTDIFPKSLSTTINAKSIVFENGVTFKYSNHGYAVLSFIIEKLSQQTYSDYVTKHILKKLGLNNTIPDYSDDKIKNLVPGYSRYLPDKSQRVKESHCATNVYASATGFISNVKDLAKFLASLHLDSKFSVLSRESKKTMMQVHGILGDEEMYGLGLALDKDSGRLTYGHSGGFAGFTTNAISEPDEDIQVIVLANTISNTAWTVSHNLMQMIFKLQSMKDVSYTEIDAFTGIYRCRWSDTSVVSLGKNLIEFNSSAINPVKAMTELEFKNKNTFKDTNKFGFGSPGEEVRFTKMESGKAQSMTCGGMIWERILS